MIKIENVKISNKSIIIITGLLSWLLNVFVHKILASKT